MDAIIVTEPEPEPEPTPTPEETAAAAIQTGMELQQRATEEANRQAQSETTATETILSRLDSLGQQVSQGFQTVNDRLLNLEAEELEPETEPESLSEATIDGAEIVEIVEATPEPESTPAPKQAPGGIRKALARVFLNK